MSLFSKQKKTRRKKIPPCSVVIAAAGFSERMRGEDKIFLEINGAPVLVHALAAFQGCELVNEIVIIVRGEHVELVCDICKHYGITKASKVVAGGPARSSSVYNGVFAVSDKAEFIAIHDGARPCVDQKTIKRAIEAAYKHNASAPAVPITYTIKRAKESIVEETVNREGLFEIQTPQVFKSELIKAALTNVMNKSIAVTDDCEAVEIIGAPVHITEGSHNNIKLTTNEDIVVAEAILAQRGCTIENCELRDAN